MFICIRLDNIHEMLVKLIMNDDEWKFWIFEILTLLNVDRLSNILCMYVFYVSYIYILYRAIQSGMFICNSLR